jgi:hypothetical protein
MKPDAPSVVDPGAANPMDQAVPDQGQRPVAETAGQSGWWAPVDLGDCVGQAGGHLPVRRHRH